MINNITPQWVVDPIKCNNLKKEWYMGQCPLCKYCVENTLDKEKCHWCGQPLKWPLTVKEWREKQNANA